MPKPIPIHIEVEEMFVGRVMRLLNGTDGVVKINLDFGQTAKPNGASAPRGPYKTRKHPVSLEETGQDLIGKTLLGKPPMTRKQLMDAFTAQGRSGASVNSVLHSMRNNGELQIGDDGGYTLTKKMRDRLRHRKAAKKT